MIPQTSDDAGHAHEMSKQRKEEIESISEMLDQSTMLLPKESIERMKKVISLMNADILRQFKEALISKQIDKLKELDSLNEKTDKTN